MKMTHLHLHSHHSALDGMGKVKELFEVAQSLGQDAMAITDHGTSSGAWEGQKEADALGMKMIHGQEFYYQREQDDKNGHLLILAKNNKGLENIFRMQEYASVHNFYYKPRLTYDIIEAHKEGLIITTACLGSPFNQYLMNGDYLEAKEWARKYHELLGEDFYIEIQPNDIPEQQIANEGSIRIAKELGIELVATNDVHYVHESDDFPHEVLLAMQMRKKMDDDDRFKFPDNNFWLKSAEEMLASFTNIDKAIAIEAIENTNVIADKCNARIETGRYLPDFYDIGEGETSRGKLIEKTMAGARTRELATNKPFMAEVQHEINVIDEEGYSDYFLIVEDYIRSARERGELIGDGRGSGSGSKVGYLTGIHTIPPHEFDLLFERFMAHGRTPDIDTDFSDQDAVFKDLQEKYGEDAVAKIATQGRLTPRLVIRRVLSAFDVDLGEIMKITSLVPDLCPNLKQAYKDAPDLLKYKKKYNVEWEVIERLEGINSFGGTHAGGVVIYPDLAKYIPIITTSEDRSRRVSAFDMDTLEEIGFYKFDILGLDTIKDIHRAVKSIEERENVSIDLENLDYEDPAVYDVLCDGDVSGVFQLSAQETKVVEQKPRSFRDLIAINALIRPGVGDWAEYLERRGGKKWNVHPDRMPYMEETEGIITYQEQYLLDAKTYAGWSIAFADKSLRKNEDIRNDKELKRRFFTDSVARGFYEVDLDIIWGEIEDAVDGGYGFNKSHSASYARMSFQTAWLKTHYPEYFYASLMSGEKTDGDGQENISAYIAEAKGRGLKILPPDINNSGDDFVVADGGINYRITTVKHVGNSAIKHIKDLRPIASFEDFLERREKRLVKKNVMVNLIKAGAFDFDNPDRSELLWQFDMSERTKTAVKNEEQTEPYEYDDIIKCNWEKEVLGMYLSMHPMEKYGFKSLAEFQEGSNALQGGEVVKIYDFHPRKNPKNPKMAFVTIDTLYGHVKLVVFASVWEVTEELFEIGNLVLVNGKRQNSDVLVNSVEVLDETS